MSSNGDASSSRNSQQTPARDICFSPLTSQNGESSSRAGSQASAQAHGSERKKRKDRTPVRDGYLRRYGDDNASKVGSHKSKRSTGGFLLDSVFSSNRSSQSSDGRESVRDGKRRALNEQERRENRQSYHSRISGESSIGSSPLGQRVQRLEYSDGGPHPPIVSSRPPSMDPAQLVQMALSLGESRRRHVSSGFRVPAQTQDDDRRVSSGSGLAGHETMRRSQGQGQRLSNTGVAVQGSEVRGHENPMTAGRHSIEPFPDLEDGDEENVLYTFTPATLARAEKARRYFELAAQHRRALQHLPPLKPDATAPGNYVFTSTNTPGGGHPTITRMRSNTGSRFELGRKYNPLQALRNRRLRTRERRSLVVAPDKFQDVDVVRDWVDLVSQAASQTSFRRGTDRVALPMFAGDDGEETVLEHNSPRRSRSSSVLMKPASDWLVEPAELLADTYWTEKGNNKSMLENRRSQQIFPDQPRESFEKSRRSTEMRRSMDRISEARTPLDASDLSDDAPENKVSKKHRLKLSIHGPDHFRRKHFTRARAASDSSVDSVDSRTARRLQADGGLEYSIGPLERHMAELIAKDERGELASPNEPMSADHWDSQHTQFPIRRNREDFGSKPPAYPQANGSLAPAHSTAHHRSKSADGRIHGAAAKPSSVDGENATDSVSPPFGTFLPSFEMDLSTPATKPSSKQKLKLSTAGIFRSRSREPNNIERTDFAEVPQTGRGSDHSVGIEERPRFSFDSLRPLPMQRLVTNESMGNSLRQVNTKDSSSTVGKLFKGNRRAGLKRNESSKLGDHFRYRDKFGDVGDDRKSSYDASDNEGPRSFMDKRDRLKSDTPDSELSPRQSLEGDRPKLFNLNLPTFKSTLNREGRTGSNSASSSRSGSLSRLQPGRGRSNKSERLDRIATRNLLTNGSPNRSRLSLTKSNRSRDARERSRRSTPNGSRVSLALGDTDESGRNGAHGPSSRFVDVGNDGHHGWSISNYNPPSQNSRITMRDVSRAKALLLASGIKAREIHRRGDGSREHQWAGLVKAVETTGKDPGPVSRRQEPIVAARLLSDTLTLELSAFEKTVENFTKHTVDGLSSRMDELKHKVAERLTDTCHDASNDAEAFTAQLATQYTIDVKNTNDALNQMFRNRHRKFRVFRRAGFKLLEWMVLGLMWWIWLVVVVFNLFRGVFMLVFRFLKWMLWL